MLTQTLRKLETYGLVARSVHAEVPPRVDYELTPLGQTLVGPIQMLTRWAEDNGLAVVEAQEASAAA